MDATTVLAAADPQGQSALLTVVTVMLGSTVIAGIFTTAIGNLRAAAGARRDRYAQVVRTLVAWVEYPYRVRRRTDDNLPTLAALAERGHSLQEQMAEDRAWVSGENRAISEVYDGCLAELARIVGPASTEAWRLPPVANAAEMVLDSFGPRDTAKIIARMNCAIGYRFGMRRIMWRGWLRRRLRARGCISAPTAPMSKDRVARVPESRPLEEYESPATMP